MNTTQIFVILAVVSVLTGLFILMLDEEKMYVKTDYNSSEVQFLQKTQKLSETQGKLYSKVDDLLNTKFGIITATYTFFSGLVELGKLLLGSVMILPEIVKGTLEIVLPPKVASVVTTAMFSIIVIVLIIKLVMFVIGKGE